MTLFTQISKKRQLAAETNDNRIAIRPIKAKAPEGYLTDEFLRCYYSIETEETFAASLPNQPRVRRDYAGEMEKICRSVHWVSTVIGRSQALNSLFAGWHRFLTDKDTGGEDLRIVTALLRR